jgi:uncharacterized membrane protein YcaP (DUF421 family)
VGGAGLGVLVVIDWGAVFQPTLPLLEMVLRGSLVYLGLFALLRVMPNREIGTMGMADLLVIVLIADAAQNAMGSAYTSVTEGMVLVATILFWSFAIDWLDYRFPQWHLAGASPVLLIRNGRILRKNLAAEKMTEEELIGQLRRQGVESASQVKKAYIESDGKISVIQRSARDHDRS